MEVFSKSNIVYLIWATQDVQRWEKRSRGVEKRYLVEIENVKATMFGL